VEKNSPALVHEQQILLGLLGLLEPVLQGFGFFSFAISGFFFLLCAFSGCFIVREFFFEVSGRRNEGAGRGIAGDAGKHISFFGTVSVGASARMSI
jgi:hypothetical protein